jgi:hypothetical protein
VTPFGLCGLKRFPVLFRGVEAHVEDPARHGVVSGNQQAGMQAFMAGKVKVQGDMTKLMAMQAAPVDDVTKQIAEEIKGMTS